MTSFESQKGWESLRLPGSLIASHSLSAETSKSAEFETGSLLSMR